MQQQISKMYSKDQPEINHFGNFNVAGRKTSTIKRGKGLALVQCLLLKEHVWQ